MEDDRGLSHVRGIIKPGYGKKGKLKEVSGALPFPQKLIEYPGGSANIKFKLSKIYDSSASDNKYELSTRVAYLDVDFDNTDELVIPAYNTDTGKIDLLAFKYNGSTFDQEVIWADIDLDTLIDLRHIANYVKFTGIATVSHLNEHSL